MSNRPDELEEDDIPETDFSAGVRGKYYDRAMQGSNVVLLEPDVAKVFRDSAVVSQALREYLVRACSSAGRSQHTFQNESLLSITDITKQKTVTSTTIRPCIDKWTFALPPEGERKAACGTEHIAMLRSGDAHTFRCMVPTMIPPTDQIGGSVELRVDYRYLRIFRPATTACFEYAPKADGQPRYIRRSCATPARTLPYDC